MRQLRHGHEINKTQERQIYSTDMGRVSYPLSRRQKASLRRNAPGTQSSRLRQIKGRVFTWRELLHFRVVEAEQIVDPGRDVMPAHSLLGDWGRIHVDRHAPAVNNTHRHQLNTTTTTTTTTRPPWRPSFSFRSRFCREPLRPEGVVNLHRYEALTLGTHSGALSLSPVTTNYIVMQKSTNVRTINDQTDVSDECLRYITANYYHSIWEPPQKKTSTKKWY